MDLRGDWSSVCPALLRYPRRNQVAPDFFAVKELSHRWGGVAALQHPHPLAALAPSPSCGREGRPPYFGAPSPASIITSSFSPALFLRRKAAASLYSCELKQATPCSKVGNSMTTKRLNLSGPSRV